MHRLIAAAALVVLLSASSAEARIAVAPDWRMGTDLTPGRGKDSIGLAVDPRNSRHIVAVNADWLSGKCQYAVSFDAGRTWRAGNFRVPAGFSPVPCTVGPHLAAHMQAGVAYGSRGNVYATFVSPRPIGAGLEEGKSLFVVASRDGGRRFSTARLIAPGGPSANQGPDYTLPTIGVDRTGSRDRVYVAASSTEASHEPVSNENVVMSVSNDAGRTWGRPFNANTPSEHAIEQSRLVVGRDGSVYIAWRDRGRSDRPGAQNPEGFIVMAKSRDHGATWNRTNIAKVRGYVYTGPPAAPFTPGQAFTASSFPRIAVDPRRDSVYVVYGQGPPQAPQAASGSPSAQAAAARAHRGPKAHASDHFINPDQDVYFQRSTDGGATWSVPRRINTAPPIDTEVTQTRHPWVDVAPNGRVDIVWQDRRNWYRGCTNTHVACEEARLGDTYYAFSTNEGKTFSRNYRLSDRSTNNDVGFDYRFGTYWAYGPVSVPMGNNHLLVGWMDSREGNVETDSQDIYLTDVTMHATGPVPVRRLPSRDPEHFSTALSRLAYPGGPEAVLAATFASRPWTRVVIANERDVSGVLAGGVLARANIAPVLVSPASGLPATVKAEVRRLAPIGAYVIGSERRLSAQVVSDLAALGIPQDQIIRLSGGDAADTARKIAEAADRRSSAERSAAKPAFNAAIIVNPRSRDAVTASVLAADRRLPVLFVGRDSVPVETAAALKELGITRTLVVGGTGAVGDGVLGQLPSPQRLGGSDEFATSQKVLGESRRRGVPDNVVYVTDGRRAMETALLGAAVGRIGGLQLLSRGGAVTARRTISRTRGLRSGVTEVVAVGPAAR